MIRSVIQWSITNRFLVLLATLLLVAAGVFSISRTPVDAIPDLSDVQVIIKTSYPGQAPQVVEDQVTYPLTSAMLAVPGAVTVRGYSFFGDSYVYIIFEDNTDIYWARSRVLEYLSQVAPSLPESARPQLGPDATGVGWVYIYSLVDESGQHDISQLRSLQDWFLKYELQTVPGVSEVATVGGMVKQYQVTVDPEKLRAFGIPLSHIETAIKRANQEVGASVIEMAEAEYMVRASGYLENETDLANVPLGAYAQGTPLLLKDVADIGIGPQMRRGVAELNGKGETVGGIIVMRFGENAQNTIDGVKEKLGQLEKSLPEGVKLVTVYDRSDLIQSAIKNLWSKLIQEFVVVGLICVIFLFHVRSSLVAIISLPVAILVAFIAMKYQGINANIMSLGGIAIAIGAMVDGAIVMVENMHKHMERTTLTEKNRWHIVRQSANEVGPALFFSLLIITVSFLPVFTLEAQEGRMFSSLAYTKTYAMAAAAALSVTLVPVLMGYFIRGKIRSEQSNPVNNVLQRAYAPTLGLVLRHPKLTIAAAGFILLSALWPVRHIGSEFIPPLDEGDLMYMPTTYPGISIGKARELLQQTDKLIATVPEVKNVFGKVGRAETATDPAPLTMIETFIQLKPRDQWREGVTPESLKDELNRLIQIPGLSNAWVMPIKTRIDMLATGIKTPVGIKVAGPDLSVIQSIGQQLERVIAKVEGTASVYSERVAGGRYLDIDIDREKAARFGLNVADVQQVISTAVGGMNITQTVEGLERYPVNLRYPQSYRDSPGQLSLLPIVTPAGERIALGDVATIAILDGPPGIKSENARINGWTFIDIDGVDLGSYVARAKQVVDQEIDLPVGYSINWAGQYEYLERAKSKLSYVVPLTILIIVVLLYLSFKSVTEVAIIMGTLPLALVGSVWLMYALEFNFSVAVGVGLIALAGVVVEIGVIMLVYLNQSIQSLPSALQSHDTITQDDFRQAVLDGACKRVRPVAMTTGATIVGLLPILFGEGTGSEVMQRLAAPMVGGMVSAMVLTLLVLPAVYFLIFRPKPKSGDAAPIPFSHRVKHASNDLLSLVRRLHLYIGLFVGPFIFVAALSGALYALTPQIEAWIYKDVLTTTSEGKTQPLSSQINAAQRYLNADVALYSVRPASEPGSTTRILFKDPDISFSKMKAVFVDPVSAEVTGVLPVYGTSGILPFRMKLDEIHRDLMLGEFGRYYSELAASWLWLTALLGVFLWSKGGKKNQRMAAQRVRHLGMRWNHGMLGLSLLLGLLFMSATGLTWSKWAGANISTVRAELGWVTPMVTLSLKPEDIGAPVDEHALHNMASMESEHKMPGQEKLFDPILALARDEGIDAAKVEVIPAANMDTAWVVKEIGQSWPTQVDSLAIDPHTMSVTSRANFADFPLIAKLIRWGVDAHIGMLFGVFNQIVVALFGLLVCVLVVLGLHMSWVRRPPAGSPARTLIQAWSKLGLTSRCAVLLVALALGLSLPVLGISLLLFLLVDAFRWHRFSSSN